MGNEEFLRATYFLVGFVCFCLGVAAYLWLRRPVEQISDALPRKGWGKILKRAFPISVILLALSGFMSVSYYGCSSLKYKDIVSDRVFIIGRAEQQVSEALFSIVTATCVWGVVILIVLVGIRREQMKGRIGGEEENHSDNDT